MVELMISRHKTLIHTRKDKLHRFRKLRFYRKFVKESCKSNIQDELENTKNSLTESSTYNEPSSNGESADCDIYIPFWIPTSESNRIPTMDSRIMSASDIEKTQTAQIDRVPGPHQCTNLSLYHQRSVQQTMSCDYSCSVVSKQRVGCAYRCNLINTTNRSWYLLLLPLLIMLPNVDCGRTINRFGVASSPGPDTTTLLGPYEDKTVYPDPSAMFSQPNNTDIYTQVGATAVLHCKPNDVGENTVSWIRRRDFHLLTVGSSSYSSDQRFHVMYIKEKNDWQLHIRYVQVRDGGTYECQVSSHPPVSLFANIQVQEATSEILSGPEKFMTAGSSLRLVCVLKQNTEEPSYVFWFHKGNMINYDTSREVKVENNGAVSILFLSNVRPEDSGNYTCSPDNAQPSHINIQVLRGGETPAAIHSGSTGSWHSSNLDILVIMLMSLVMLCFNPGASLPQWPEADISMKQCYVSLKYA